MEMKGTFKKGMRMATVSFSSIVLLLLLTSPAGAQVQCACDGCHGNPPTVNTRGGPNGLVGMGLGMGTSAGGHDHFTKLKQNLTCENCHFNAMPASPIPDFKLQIGFSINGKSWPGAIYDGLTSFADPSWKYEATNETTVTQNGSLKCFNVYCHGGGLGGTNNTGGITKSPFLNSINDPRHVEPSVSPSWYNTAPIGCAYCHGIGTTDGRPLYQDGDPKANGHLTHLDVKCHTCHYVTTRDDANIYDVTKHHNGIYDVVPDPTLATPFGPNNFTYTYDAGGGKCTNVACHGGGTGYWGSPTLGSTGVSASVGIAMGSGCYQINVTATPYTSVRGTPPFTYDMDWGDGSTTQGTSPNSNPVILSHSYAVGGTYYPMFNFRDASYISGSSAPVPVTPGTVNIPPVAASSVSSSGFVVTLTDLSSDPDYKTCGHSGAGTLYINWNDGTTTNQPISLTDKPSNLPFQHTYSFTGTSPRTYYLTHYVKDNAGALVWEASSIPVTVTPPTYTVSGKITHFGGSGYTAGQAFSNCEVDVNTVAGVLVTSSYTKADGTYTITGITAGQSYNVVPVMAYFSFTPASVTITQSTADVNFVGKP